MSLLASYVRRKRFEAQLIALEFGGLLTRATGPQRVAPDAMLGELGIRL